MASLLEAIKTQAQITDSVLVSFSMGKDSIVTLDLCMKYFKHVEAFFMYLVPELEFQESALSKYERHYGIKIMRVPHFENSDFYRFGSFRDPDYSVPRITINNIYNYVRDKTGIEWIAGGEKIADSIVRLSMLKHSGSIDEKRRRFYPVMYWHDAEIKRYMKINHLLYPEFNRELGFSFHSLAGKELAAIKHIYPQDYERIIKFFPEARAGVLQYEAYKSGGEN